MDDPVSGVPAGSYWEDSVDGEDPIAAPLQGDGHFDVVIVGGGYTGLSTALHLRRMCRASVAVVDAAEPGWGASGRNGGWACMGSSRLDWPTIVRRHGLEEAVRFYRIQRSAVHLVRALCEEAGIDAWLTEDGLVTLAHRPSRLQSLRSEAQFLREHFGETTTLLDRGELRERGLHGAEFAGGLLEPHGFGLHPLRYLRGLGRAAADAGATLLRAAPLLEWQRVRGRHDLVTAGGRLQADHVVFATNAYTPESRIEPLAGRLMPIVSAIIVTRPMTEAELEAQCWTSRMPASDTRRLLHYFRLLPNGRFLFGGRGTLRPTRRAIRATELRLRRALDRMFPAWRQVEHTHSWYGRICFTGAGTPFVGPLDASRSVWSGIGYHGNGVAMSTWSGRTLAGMIAGDTADPSVPGFLTRRPPRFPMPFLRPLYLRAAYLSYALRDRFR